MKITIKRERFVELSSKMKEVQQQYLERVSLEMLKRVSEFPDLKPMIVRDGQNEANELCAEVEAWLEANEGL